LINKPGRNDLAGQPRARREPRHRLNQGHLNIWVLSPIRKEGVRILEIANKKLKITIHMVSRAISSQAHKAKLCSFLRIPRLLSSMFTIPSTLANPSPCRPTGRDRRFVSSCLAPVVFLLTSSIVATFVFVNSVRPQLKRPKERSAEITTTTVSAVFDRLFLVTHHSPKRIQRIELGRPSSIACGQA
jgi:hypothetical protein